MTKKIFGCAIIVVVFLAGSYAGYIAGVEDEDFDRTVANIKLQNCLAVVRQ